MKEQKHAGAKPLYDLASEANNLSQIIFRYGRVPWPRAYGHEIRPVY